MTTPLLVVVAGGTASGKSTATRAAAAHFGALHIEHDRYYLDVDEPRGHNYDHPDALDTDLLVANLTELVAGRATELPVYNFGTHTRLARVDRVEPTQIILLDGILVLADPRIARLAHMSVYVDAPADLRLVRRIRRDVVERDRDVAGVLDQYLATVRPMHERFVAPCAARADLVLDGTAPEQAVADALIAAIEARG